MNYADSAQESQKRHLSKIRPHGLVRRAIWSASALLLAIVSFGVGRFSSFRPFPEIVATLLGDEFGFSREFDGRIRERFPIGSSEDKLVDFLGSEGFSRLAASRQPQRELLRSERTHMPENRSCLLARRRDWGSHGRPRRIRKPMDMMAFSRSRSFVGVNGRLATTGEADFAISSNTRGLEC